MFRAFIGASLLACTIPAQAGTWNFVYQGFHDTVADTFDATRRLRGSFTGTDSNGDGTIARNEISKLLINGYDYVGCESQSGEYWHCGAELFSYTPGGALDFTVGQYGSDPEGWVGGGLYFTAGDGEHGYLYRPNHYEEWAHLWTAQTTFAISPAPEPATWGLLLAGLPLALWVSARRSRATVRARS
jgi:hypothetical protein